MYEYDMEKQMFFDNPQKYNNLCETNYLIETPAKVTEVEDGIILPLRWTDEKKEQPEGGVCDKNGGFIAGHIFNYDVSEFKHGHSCLNSYTINEDVLSINETVIYGGLCLDHFGHFITESFSRLWYFAKNNDIKFKLVFIVLPGKKNILFSKILYNLGLTDNDFEIILKPTRFSKIIVPEQTLYYAGGYRKEAKYIYDFCIHKASANIDNKFINKSYSKVYLSKSKYFESNSTREKYFEDFYKKRGFEIIYPETLSFLEQVYIVSCADEIVCVTGTLIHLTFFCRENTVVTILSRTNDRPSNPLGIFSLQLRELESYFVDISINFLPVHYNRSSFFWGPTKHWVNYLNSRNIEYSMDEISWDIHVKPYVYDYLISWAENNHNSADSFQRVKNATFPDFINGIYTTFLDSELDVSKFPESDVIVKLKEENKKLKNETQSLKENNQIVKDEQQKLKENNQLLKDEQQKSENESHKHIELNQILNDLNQSLKENNQNIRTENKNLIEYKSNCIKLEEELKIWKQHVKNMENTRSWKITKPLRFIKKVFNL